MDVDHIPAGVDFVEHLNSQVAACKVLLVVIGPNWLNAKDEAGQRRLDNPGDFVAIEIEAALVRDIRVIPVLVDGADLPKPSELPDSLKRLARRQGVEVRNNHFGRDADALIEKVREALGGSVLRRPWRRMAVASATAALLLGGSIALFWIWEPPTIETMVPQEPRAEAKRNAEEAEQQRVAAAKAEEERKAKAAAEAEAQRKSQEAEQQRLAAAKAEEERKAKAAAEAEAQRKSQEAEQQRLAAAKAEEERKAKAAAEAEAQRKSQEAEQQRLAAAKAEEERKAKAAAEAEAQRKSQEAEQQRLAAAKAEEERKATQEAQLAGSAAAGFNIINNFAVEGDDYRRIRDATIESCSSACAGDAQCKMFAYWQTRVCYLFDKVLGTYSQATAQVGFVRATASSDSKIPHYLLAPSSTPNEAPPVTESTTAASDSKIPHYLLAPSSTPNEAPPATESTTAASDSKIPHYLLAPSSTPNEAPPATESTTAASDSKIPHYLLAPSSTPNEAPPATESTSKNPRLYLNRGNAYWNKGQVDEAIADYDEAIRLNPSYTVAFYDRGHAYEWKGDYRRALADYSDAIRLDPKYDAALCARGRLKLRLNSAFCASNACPERSRKLNDQNAMTEYMSCFTSREATKYRHVDD